MMHDLEKRAEQLAYDYSKSPDSVSRQEVVDLITDTYRRAVELFDAKVARGESLLPQEQEIYDLCKRELKGNADSGRQLTSVYGALFNSIELIRNCIAAVADWFQVNSETDRADMCLVRAGNVILPGYASVLEEFFMTISEFFSPAFVPSAVGLAEGQAECALFYQEKRTVDKALADSMLTIAGYAYEGHPVSTGAEYQKLSKEELPPDIRVLYDEQQGLLSASNGLKIWIGKKDNAIVVSYSGTDVRDADMVYADIIQLSAPSVLYLKAAGFLKMMLDYIPDKQFYVTGHSLGGGLTQFSVAANMDQHGNRLQGYGYNPAGLSMTSLRHLGSSRLKNACKKMWIFMTCYDPVSLVGGKIGCLTTLPKTAQNGHGMADLKVCMQKYLSYSEPAPSADVQITWRNHAENDFIPYTRKLSCVSSAGTIYPIFNRNVLTESESILTVSIPQSVFSCLDFQIGTVDCCMGIYNKLNGTAHTVMNRLLLLTSGEPKVTDRSIGNLHSSIIYGKFGLGIEQFIASVEKVYVESQEVFSGSRTAYEKVLSKLNNPFEYDKKAWCDGIRIQFGINMQDIFSKWPLAEKYFDIFLNKVTSDRIDIYRSVTSEMQPGQEAVKTFLSRFEESTLKNIEKLLDEAVRWTVITAADEKQYLDVIRRFCDRVIEESGR